MCDHGMTREEVAESLGISPGLVRRIELRALRKCLKWCEEHGLELSDLLIEDNDNEHTQFRS